MGVFSERLFAVFLVAMPWRHPEIARASEEHDQATAREFRAPTPTWQSWDMQSPTTSTMRADLEALRTYSRVR
jgi:hypothetical protein